MEKRGEKVTWRRSLTLSMGATAVLEMAAAIPPARKSLAKEIAVSLIFRCSQAPSRFLCSVGFACEVEMADPGLEERGFKKTEREKNRELRLARLIGWRCGQWAGLADVLRFRFGAFPYHSSVS